jgi:hypothetical protein
MKTNQQDFATAGSAFQTVGIDLGDNVSYSFHCNFSGATLAGTAKLQGSNDNSDWVDLGISATPASAASVLLNSAVAGYRYVRFDWAPSGGSGTATVISTVKEVARTA